MARLNANKLYRITKDIGGNNIRLQFYASDNDLSNPFPPSPTIVDLNSNCLRSCRLNAEFDNLALGLMSLPIIEVDIDISKTLAEFNTLLKDPYRTYSISTSMPSSDYISGSGISPLSYEITSGNILELYINDVLSFVGFQKTTLENNYDSENYIQKVEFWHTARVITENMTFDICTQLAALKTDNDVIRQSTVAYDMIFRETLWTGGVSVFAQAATPPLNHYYYFIRLNTFYAHLNIVYNQILNRLTRTRYTSVSDPLPTITNIQLYKQSYRKEIDRSNTFVMTDSDDIYFLGFVSTKNLAGRVSGQWQIVESFFTALENYQNVWDFYFAHAKSSFVRMSGKINGLIIENLFTLTTQSIDNDMTLSRPTLELDYNVLRRAESASVEKYDDDVDKIESVFAGSRSATVENLTVIFNNNICVRKTAQGTELLTSKIQNDRAKMLKLSTAFFPFVKRHFSPLFLAYYYFERPFVTEYLTTESVPILYNHNFNIVLGAGIETDDFLSEVTQTWTGVTNTYFFQNQFEGAIIDLASRSGGSLYVFSRCLLMLFKAFSDNFNVTKQQGKVTLRYTPLIAFAREFANGKSQRISYDLSVLSPSNDLNFFDNVMNELYIIKYELNLDCTNNNGQQIICELEAVARSYE